MGACYASFLYLVLVCCLSPKALQVLGDEIPPMTMAIIKSVLKDPESVRIFAEAALRNPKMIREMAGQKRHGLEAYVKAAWELMQDPEVMRGVMQGGWGTVVSMARRPVQSVLGVVGGLTSLVLPERIRK